MRSSSRARARSSLVEACLLGAALAPFAAASGCGRIGYDPLPETTAGSAGADAMAQHDATALGEGGGHDASEDVTSTPTQDATSDVGPTDAADAQEEQDAASDGSSADADATCATTAAVDYCQVIPPLPAPPVIDGVLDCGPTLVPVVPEDWRGAAPLPPFPANNTAEVAAAWRPEGLYVFIAVTTPIAIPADPASQDYFGAGVELFLDSDGVFSNAPQYDDPGTVQIIVTAPPYPPGDAAAEVCPIDASDEGVDAADQAGLDADEEGGGDALDEAFDAPSATSPNGQRAEIYRNEGAVGPWTSSQFGTFPTPSGFAFEGFFVAADLGLTTWTLAAGAQVGFDVAVDVSFPDYCTTGLEGHRAGQYFLNVATTPVDAAADADAGPIGAPYEDTRSFCTPTLRAPR